MTNQEAFTEIARQLAPLGVIKSQMFGMPTWKLNGKALGGPWQDDMVFKLKDADLTEALKLSGTRLFDPMGGRPMKQWVQLSAEHQTKWQHFAKLAAEALV